MNAAIEIIERFDAKDIRDAWVSAGLPDGYYCHIRRDDERGGWNVKTKNGCKPSIRYYWFSSTDAAYAFGVRWAKRQQKEVARLACRGNV